MFRFTSVVLFILISLNSILAQEWVSYTSPEEAGWSSEKLQEAFEYAEEINSAAFLLIHDGKVVASNGDVLRRFMCHSVRKSLLSALYGIYVDNGVIDLDKSLADLGIDDTHHLTDLEKSSTLRDIIKARSGVYHPAAYETEAMKKARPLRESHAPGTFWYYNNWDFNTLCAILMKEAEIDFFSDFKAKIADPIGMEDFRLSDTYYHLEADESRYPAYPFRLSARDLARLGQLFLNDGSWDGRQIVPAAWIEESTTPYSHNTRNEGWGYGYMWWTGLYGADHPNYSAQGVGNQAIIVFPEDNVVMVNRTNTYEGKNVKPSDLLKLTELIWDAQTGKSRKKAKTVNFNPAPSYSEFSPIQLSDKVLKSYAGSYTLEGNSIEIELSAHQLVANTSFEGNFNLIPVGDDKFLAEDAQWIIKFSRDVNNTLMKEVQFK